MSTNQKALELFEQNEYEKALELFRQAVEESRNIQSLNNLAWMYSYEEEDDQKALELLKEVIEMKPASYFPYNLLGEINLRQKHWKLASDALSESISIQPSKESYQNLAVAKYYLKELEEASDYFLRVAGNSDVVMFNHIKCLIELDKKTEAKEKLDTFSEDADDFIGEVEVADLYVELGCFKEAIQWFEKGWEEYWKTPNWVSRFVYALFKTKNNLRINEVIQESILHKAEEIKSAHEEECDDNWTESDKEAHMKELLEEKNEYENMVNRMSSGYIPLIEFDPATTGACYLFGCKRHNHPDYQE